MYITCHFNVHYTYVGLEHLYNTFIPTLYVHKVYIAQHSTYILLTCKRLIRYIYEHVFMYLTNKKNAFNDLKCTLYVLFNLMYWSSCLQL